MFWNQIFVTSYSNIFNKLNYVLCVVFTFLLITTGFSCVILYRIICKLRNIDCWGWGFLYDSYNNTGKTNHNVTMKSGRTIKDTSGSVLVKYLQFIVNGPCRYFLLGAAQSISNANLQIFKYILLIILTYSMIVCIRK
jgi:hypothetical protein